MRIIIMLYWLHAVQVTVILEATIEKIELELTPSGR